LSVIGTPLGEHQTIFSRCLEVPIREFACAPGFALLRNFRKVGQNVVSARSIRCAICFYIDEGPALKTQDMVFVPASCFTMGREDGNADE
jgi:hypothetical protein